MHSAYEQARSRAESPRELEYRLFGQVTRSLMDAAQLPEHELGKRMEALDWNRKLWTALASSCADSNNDLPDPTRASIISLAIWVDKHTTLVMRRQEQIDPLVEINRMIMQGLAARNGDSAAA